MPFRKGDWLLLPGIRAVLAEGRMPQAYVIRDGNLIETELTIGALTEDERQIILDGCLINYNRQE